MADLAALGAAHEPGFARREGREVVVMHVTLRVLRGECVEHLFHLEHAQGGDVHHLGLATLEEGGAVGPLDDSHLGRQRPDVVGPAAVEAHALVEDAVPHHLLEDRLEGTGGLLVGLEILLGNRHLGQGGLEGGGLRLLALGLVGGANHVGQPGTGDLGHPVLDLLGVVEGAGPLGRSGVHLGGQIGDEVDDGRDVLLGLLQPGGDCRLVGRRIAVGDQAQAVGSGAGLDHHDVDLALLVATSGDHDLEDRLVEFLFRREGDPLPLLEGQAHAADRPVEGYRGHGQRRRGPVEGHHVEGVLAVHRQRGDDDVGLTSVVVVEGRTEGAVDEAAGQDGLVARAALAPEEGTGDATGGIHPLLEVDGEREEVDAFAHRLVGGGGGQHLGSTQRGHHGTVGLTGQLAGGEGKRLAAYLTGYGDFGHLCAPLSSGSGPLAVVNPRGGGLTTDNRPAPWLSGRTAPESIVAIPVAGRGTGPELEEGAVKRPLRFSAPETEAGDQAAISLDVLPAEVVEEPAPLADQHQQPAAAVMVVLVVAKVLGEVGDALREECHLDLGRAGIAVVVSVLGHDLLRGLHCA